MAFPDGYDLNDEADVYWIQDYYYDPQTNEQIAMAPTLFSGRYDSFDCRHNCANVQRSDGYWVYLDLDSLFLDPQEAIDEYLENLTTNFQSQLGEIKHEKTQQKA